MNHSRNEERTGFQEKVAYNAEFDLQTDFVMVYGIDDTMPERISEFRQKGYVVHLMTGVSWGVYGEYLTGKVDGLLHWDESQKKQSGEHMTHGKPDMPYMVPTIAYADFLTTRIKAAVDAGVEAIHMEEPEFWGESGYSEAFKREWELFFKEPWRDPYSSEDAQYKASKLKAYLYTRCLDRVCGALKEYAKIKYNRQLRFYVPTHSLVNYSHWKIISPESKLLDLPTIDGYIAQVWTGTARTSNVYQGIRKERTFETAFLEYGIMQELVSGTDRRMWFLHDPIEDNPNHTWDDYRDNYFKTVVASLLHPEVSNYEVSPWPNRVFQGGTDEFGKTRNRLPDDYATTLLTIFHTLGNMKHGNVKWQSNNTTIGVLLADSAMFQRQQIQQPKKEISKNDIRNAESGSWSSNWSSFYGLALPLLKQGALVRPVQLDNIRRFSSYLDDHRVLLLSYEFMKPENPEIHNALAQWVREGGVLIYVGNHTDPYHNVKEWWNTGKRQYASPAHHLFNTLELTSNPAEGIHRVGKGVFGYLFCSPNDCAFDVQGAESLRKTVQRSIDGLDDSSLHLEPKNHFILERGPYVIAAVLEESVSEATITLEGRYVNLLGPSLEIVTEVTVAPGENVLLYNLDYISSQTAELISISSRMEAFEELSGGFRFVAKGPDKVQAVALFYVKNKPTTVTAFANGKEKLLESHWNEEHKTLFIKYPNTPDGLTVQVEYS